MNALIDGGSTPRALLALEDGSVFEGFCAGAEGETFGEVVFNTSMVGYQEIVSDPSYAGQIVTLTYPQVGNYGVCDEVMQSPELYLRGLVVHDMCHTPSNWTSAGSRRACTGNAPAGCTGTHLPQLRKACPRRQPLLHFLRHENRRIRAGQTRQT